MVTERNSRVDLNPQKDFLDFLGWMVGRQQTPKQQFVTADIAELKQIDLLERRK
ncbi:MAG: hypothetical protein CSYNP_03151 [Syntrophus sp. SKADARSKE-3]|nr:hypothetical protein [Syntrophus sp. SKADARSKE-3]